MIKNREDLNKYMMLDEYALERHHKWYKFNDPILRFERILRKHEYYANNRNKSFIHKLLNYYFGVRHSKLGIKLGFDIPINVFGPGLRINHFGLIIVNSHAKIGAFCDIHQGVNIGMQGNSADDCPTIGDNVWIGPGAKLFGKISIADNCQIGANAVVNKSFNTPGISIAGIPAKQISNHANPYIRAHKCEL